MTDHILNIFVYGTLQPGEYYYPKYCAGKIIGSCQAIAHGNLYDLPLGYPAMIIGNGIVHGYRLSFNDISILNALDELEDYDPNRPDYENEYQREQVEIFTLSGNSLGVAWAYLMDSERVNHLGGRYLADGKWTKQHQTA